MVTIIFKHHAPFFCGGGAGEYHLFNIFLVPVYFIFPGSFACK